MPEYKRLDAAQVTQLTQNNCTAQKWDEVFVTEEFSPDYVRSVHFSGTVKIGSLGAKIKSISSTPITSSINNTRLHNVTLGDHCFISNTGCEISNIKIGNHCFIENNGLISCSPGSQFGNSSRAAVINEAGGREIPITTETTAQTAWLSALCRDKKEVIAAIEELSDAYAESVRSDYGSIDDNAIIINCKVIKNVSIGTHAYINGVELLEDGTVESTESAPTKVVYGVIASQFIFQKGSDISGQAQLEKTLIGEGSRVGKQFSAENSVFFANSECFHSEAVSVFGGPYTVTHHRSTLLIALGLSFFNAGSGTNQSNHRYKLGPVHQGILERGCKTGSNSYILLPGRIGAFSAIIGKHMSNFDTGKFPFSIITETMGKSFIIPGMNFFNAGTFRDGIKWPQRDKRTHCRKRDIVHFDILSPYTMSKVFQGITLLNNLIENCREGQEIFFIEGISLKRALVRKSLRYYADISDIFFGEMLTQHQDMFISDITSSQKEQSGGNTEIWVDMGGMFCPQSRFESLCTDLKSKKINSLEELQKAFRAIESLHNQDVWQWTKKAYFEQNNASILSADQYEKVLEKWFEKSKKYSSLVSSDALKDLAPGMKLGYGHNGDRDLDFEAVRGTADSNSFLKEIQNRDLDIENTYNKMLKKLKALC